MQKLEITGIMKFMRAKVTFFRKIRQASPSQQQPQRKDRQTSPPQQKFQLLW